MGDKMNPESIITTELVVNGSKVELNDFVQRFIGQAVLAMVTSLRGVGPVRRVRLDISNGSQQAGTA